MLARIFKKLARRRSFLFQSSAPERILRFSWAERICARAVVKATLRMLAAFVLGF